MIANEVATLVQKYYQLEGTFQQLAGYEDKNFLLKTKSGTKYIVKLSIDTSEESQSLLSEQNQFLQYLSTFHRADFRTSAVFLGENKVDLIKVKVGEESYFLRILTFIEGQFIGDLVEENKAELFVRIADFVQLLDFDKDACA